VKSDDSVWFTDPPFGILGNYEGHVATPELPTNVYRLDKTGRATVVAGDINRPNGLAFSPDESKLYIVEAGVMPRVIRVYDVVDNGSKLANGRAFITAEPGGTPDGFRCDVDGNLWCGWGMGNENQDGVRIFNPEGKPIKIDQKLVFGRCLHRQVGRLLTLEDAINVTTRLLIEIDKIGPVRDQAAGGDTGAFEIDCGQLITCRKRDYQIAMTQRGPARRHEYAAI